MFFRLVLNIGILLLFFVTVPQVAGAQAPRAFSDPGAGQSSGGGSAGFVPVEPSVDGGAIPIGATAQVVVRFRNDSGQAIETKLIRLYPSSTVSAVISLNQCGEEPLSPGAECAIALSVKALQAGAWRVEMLISHSGPRRLASATLSGTVEASGESSDKLTSDIEAIPDELDFESLTASQTLVEPVILRNITSVPLNISDIYLDASDNAGFSLKSECEALQPGQACIATVRWSPKLKGPVSGVLVVKHDGPTALSSVPIRGEYEPDTVDEAEVFPEAVPGKGLLVASQTEIDFGDDIKTTSTITVSLVNAGDSDLTLKDIVIAGSDNGLSVKGSGCSAGQVLEPIEACPLTLAWAPTRVGTLLDDIKVVHDGARGVLVLPVRGESSGSVSQDQGTIMLSSNNPDVVAVDRPSRPVQPSDSSGNAQDSDVQAAINAAMANQQDSGSSNYVTNVANPASVLDGLKITSFSATRAIVAGPGGSRLVFDDEDIVLGGVPWSVNIQKNGIEFTHQGQTVLLLFDRSLSSVNRVKSQSNSNSSSDSGEDTTDDE